MAESACYLRQVSPPWAERTGLGTWGGRWWTRRWSQRCRRRSWETSAWQPQPGSSTPAPPLDGYGMQMSSPAPARAVTSPSSNALAGADANLASIAQLTPHASPAHTLRPQGEVLRAKACWTRRERSELSPGSCTRWQRLGGLAMGTCPRAHAPPALQPVKGLLFPGQWGTQAARGEPVGLSRAWAARTGHGRGLGSGPHRVRD